MSDSVYLSPFLVVPLLSRCRHVGHSAGKPSSPLSLQKARDKQSKGGRMPLACVPETDERRE